MGRKYDLDALRVGAFAVLILFHVGLLYAPWPYNLKSPRLAPAIVAPLSAVSPWRLALVFVISGVASRTLVDRIGPRRFALDRLRRLQPAILFGMAVIVPPQTYVELVAKSGLKTSYLDFWIGSYLRADQTLARPLGKTFPTWDHLWFLVYLQVYTLIYALVARPVDRAITSLDDRRAALCLYLVPPVFIAACDRLIATVSPFTHALAGDWAADVKWLGLFFVGVAAADNQAFWAGVAGRRRALALVAALLLAARLAVDQASGPSASPWLRALGVAIEGVYAWTAVLALFGWARTAIRRPSPMLSYLNQAILPLYVLHQPILLIAAYLIFPAALPLPLEALALIAVTAAGSLTLYEGLIRRVGWLRVLFGLRPDRSPAGTDGPPRPSPGAARRRPAMGSPRRV